MCNTMLQSFTQYNIFSHNEHHAAAIKVYSRLITWRHNGAACMYNILTTSSCNGKSSLLSGFIAKYLQADVGFLSRIDFDGISFYYIFTITGKNIGSFIKTIFGFLTLYRLLQFSEMCRGTSRKIHLASLSPSSSIDQRAYHDR